MKKRFPLYGAALAIFLFAGVLPLWAQEGTSSPMRTKRLDTALTKIPKRMTTVSARITSAVEKVEKRIESLQDRKQQALVIAQKKLDLLDALWARVESRMKKMEGNGQNLSSLQTKVKDVQLKRQLAIDAITQAKAALAAEATSAAIQKPKLQRLKIVPALRAYHQSIVTVIRSLGAIRRVKPSVSLTPTPTGATTPAP